MRLMPSRLRKGRTQDVELAASRGLRATSGRPNCISGQKGNIVGGVLMPVWMLVLGWLAVGACFLFPPGARAQVGPDLPPLLPSPGRVITDYLAASSQRALRLLTAQEALESCGQCADRARLQEKYDRLQEEERQVRA